MRRAICLLVIAAGISVSLVYAQVESKRPVKVAAEAPQVKRFLYLVRYGTAKDLAAALTQHYKDEAGMQIVPEATANALLISAPSTVSDELVKLLDQLDRRPRQVVIDVLVAEMPVDEKDKAIDPAEFSGPAETVLPKVEALARKSKLNHLRRFRITALENQRSMILIGGSHPMVTGVGAVGGGFGGRGAPGAGGPMMQNQITYREVGTMMSTTPRVAADGAVTLALQVEESRVHVPENGIALGGGVVAPEVLKTTLNGTLSVPAGKAVLAEGVNTEAKGAKVQSVVIVVAQVLDK